LGSPGFLFAFTIGYVVYRHIRKDLFRGAGLTQPEHCANGAVLAAAAVMLEVQRGAEAPFLEPAGDTAPAWGKRVLVLAVPVAVLAWLSTGVHHELPGAQTRF